MASNIARRGIKRTAVLLNGMASSWIEIGMSVSSAVHQIRPWRESAVADSWTICLFAGIRTFGLRAFRNLG